MDKIKRNMIYNLIKTLFIFLIPMATFFYTVRVFSVEDIGVINYSRSIVSYFVLFAGMGIKNYGIREGSKLINEKEKFNNFVSTLFYINIIVVILAYVFLYLFFTVVMFDDIIIYLSIILSFQFLSNFIFLDWVFEIFENYRYLSYLNIIVQAIVLILVIAFVNEPSHIFRYVSISVFLPLIFSIYSFFIAKKHFTFVFIKKNDVKKHLRPIFIIFFTMISTTIYVNSDITILGIMSDNYTVGIYSLSAKLYNIVKMLFISIIVVTIPSLSRDFSNKDHHVYIKKINNLLTTVYSFLLPLILGAFLLSKEMITTLAGTQYLESVTSFRLLLFSLVLSLTGFLLGQTILLIQNKEKILMYITLVGAIINILLNFILIPYYNEIAAAFSTAISEFIVVFVIIGSTYKFIMVKELKRNIIKMILGCLVILVIYFALNLIFEDNIYIKLIFVILSIILYTLIEVLLNNETIKSLFIKNKDNFIERE